NEMCSTDIVAPHRRDLATVRLVVSLLFLRVNHFHFVIFCEMSLLVVKAAFIGCCRQSVRTIHFNKPRLDRYSRETFRNRLHRQELKDAKKPPSSHQDATILADSVPVRPVSDLLKALGFTVGVGAVSFSIAYLSDWERSKTLLKKHFHQHAADFFKPLVPPPTDPQYRELTHGEKCAAFLIVSNTLVFLLWRAKGLQPMMWRYFSNSYASKSLLSPMILSAFSHSSFIHLGLNMYVLWTFAQVTVDKFLGPDQFFAFYLTAAAVSSWTSLAHKAAVRSPIRALGASGAILALLAYTCCKIPDARLKIVFLPFFDFSAQSAVIGMVIFDLAGLLFRFKLFDHAAHLGGALFGIAYAYWGERFLWGCVRKHVQKKVQN
ncbi:rom-5, partial [Pristionchus pacificus]